MSDGWKKPDEEMPTSGADILFDVPGCYGVEKGAFREDKWTSDRTSPYGDEVSFVTCEVAWWMPTPQPPTGGTA